MREEKFELLVSSFFSVFSVDEEVLFVARFSEGFAVDRFFSSNFRDRCASSAATFFASSRANRSANEFDEGRVSGERFLSNVMTFV